MFSAIKRLFGKEEDNAMEVGCHDYTGLGAPKKQVVFAYSNFPTISLDEGDPDTYHHVLFAFVDAPDTQGARKRKHGGLKAETPYPVGRLNISREDSAFQIVGREEVYDPRDFSFVDESGYGVNVYRSGRVDSDNSGKTLKLYPQYVG